ncbi:mechanosensitive ion channel protein 6-like [Phalaenopsis equestris]|uniref:mechanosensitive ion channel protein 6-like n=1 Tax=Phalaenopsis equestris TaxID=78828 RepID=UPI0009E62A63|nr:mechanosensitive ion channel protein 6-like [Phalaenopsis equestris]
MNVLRKSFKSHNSYKISSVWNQSEDQRPILACDPLEESVDRRDVVVRVEGDIQMKNGNPFGITPEVNKSKVWRESSYDFWKEGHLGNGGGGDGGDGLVFSFQSPTKKDMEESNEDPPSRLISSFLQKQKVAGAEMALDMDIEMEELKKPTTSSTSPSSKEQRVSLPDVFNNPPSRNSHVESDDDDDSDGRVEVLELRRTSATASLHSKEGDTGTEVLRCTSNSSFGRNRPLLRAKTRSRLMDPPPSTTVGVGSDEKKSMRMPNRSGQIPQRSGLLGMSRVTEEDEDDPFGDLPEEFKGTKISKWAILELIGLFLVLGALICSLAMPKLARQTVWGLHLWKWELLVLVLMSGRLLSGWLVRIIVFFLERNFFLRKRFLYFVYGVRRAVQNCIWFGLVLLAWHFLFDKKVVGETKVLSYITKILFCLIVATVLRLIKTLLVKVLASSFHVSTYFDRIQEALFNQYIIETLSGPPLLEIQHNMEEEDRMMTEMQKLQNAGATIPNDLREVTRSCKNGRVIGGSGGIGHGGTGVKSSQIGKSTKLSGSSSRKDFSRQLLQQKGGITVEQLHKFNQKNISAWNMKRLMRIVRLGTLTTLDEQLPQGMEEDESTIQIKSENEAKIAARKIFNNVAKPGAKYIYLADMMRFMREDEAVKTMNLLNGAQDDRVSKRILKNWVVNAFRERRALSLTLNDTKTAVNKLHQIANVIVVIIVFALWLLILNIATTHFFVFLSSQFLLLVFVFGNTFKTTFEAMIFLFVMHPFDVGDRCEVNGVQMVVEEMNILTTIFLRYDNQKITYPNSVLATLPIGNFYRSPDMGDSVDFCVHVSTPLEKLAAMREKIITFMESKKEHWYPGAQVVVKDVDDMNRLKIAIWMRHRMNFQDMGMKSTRRELVVLELIRVLRELDIEYRMLPMDVNVRNLPPVDSNRLPSTWTTCA